MSKLKALFITAILGSSTAAMASPSLTFSAGAQFSFGTAASAPDFRDHRTMVPPPAYQMPSSTTSIKLAGYLGLTSGRDVLQVGANAKNAEGLTLEVSSGMGFVQKVQLKYKNGSTKTIKVNQWLTTRSPAIDVELKGKRQLAQITIIGTRSGQLSYQLFATVENEVPVYQPPPVVQPRIPHVAATYQSNRGDVVITQNGNHIHGTFVNNSGTLDGTIDGNVIHFRWSQRNGGGMGTWVIDGRGHLTGTFGMNESATSWAWNLTDRQLLGR
jgi:hypothetical protein